FRPRRDLEKVWVTATRSQNAQKRYGQSRCCTLSRPDRVAACPMLPLAAMHSCLRRTVLAATAWVLVGCLSPTLPLPPPGAPSVTDQGDGTYLLTGSAPPNSEVYALNTRTMLINGQATGDTGEYSFTVEAQPRDPIELWYTSGTRESQITSFEIPAP